MITRVLAPDVAHAHAAAHDAVRRKGGGEVTETHVLAELATAPAVLAYVAREGLSIARLGDAADAGVDGLERAYRDAPEPVVVADALDELFDDAARGWFAGHALDATVFVETFFASARGRALKKRARFDRAPLDAVARRAEIVRKTMRMPTTLLAHGVLALFDTPDFVDALGIAGVHAETAQSALRASGAAGHAMPDVDTLLPIATKQANVLRRRDFDLPVLVASVLLAPAATETLAAAELDAFAILWALVHGPGDARSSEADALFVAVRSAHGW